MGHLTWDVIALAKSAILGAGEVAADLSITHLFFMVTTTLLVLFLYGRYATFGRFLGRGSSSDSHQAPTSWRTELQVHQLNGSLYELHKPKDTPSMVVVFFHGLYLGDYSEEHLSTWVDEDRSCIWPQTWLVEEFPSARILFVSYRGCVGRKSHGNLDMDNIVENLILDLMVEKIGETPNCPIILVGHCFGGLVIKQACLRASYLLTLTRTDREKEKLKNFLDKVKVIFYYGTPHRGSPYLTKEPNVLHSNLLRYFKTLGKEAGRLGYEFNQLLRSHPKWRIGGVVGSLPAKSGLLQGQVLVPEEYARDGDQFNILATDHASISNPKNKRDRRFYYLTSFIRNNTGNLEAVHQRQGIPEYAIELEGRAQEIEEKLKGATILGIFGMGGIGKTTLAKQVFNRISATFEYTCFADNVKGIPIHALEDWLLDHFYHSGTKMNKSTTEWLPFKEKKMLIIMDDVNSEDQLRILPKMHYFGNGSRLIITSRERDILNIYDNFGIYEVDFLDKDAARKLFCQHVFDQEVIPDDLSRTEHLITNVQAMVKKCDGLPLTLQVIGRYLRGHVNNGNVWEETIKKLEKAQAINGSQNDRVWASLKVSFETLSKEEQEMFIEAATVFFERPLDHAFAAWSTTGWFLETTWANLVNRSLVKEVEKFSDEQRAYKEVWVHEQLRDLAMSLSEGRIVVGSDDPANISVDQLNASQVEAKTKVLQLSYHRNFSKQDRKTLQLDSLVKLPDLKYLILDGVVHEGWGQGLPRNLSLLRLQGNRQSHFPIDLNKMSNLAILELNGFKVSKEFLEALETLTNLRILSLRRLRGLQRLPEDCSYLSRLRQLDLISLGLRTLPESFGELSSLVNLKITKCDNLVTLPESFGRSLKSLEYLYIAECPVLQGLPHSFSQLPRLEVLNIWGCQKFEDLGDSFGNLHALRRLYLRDTNLHQLPASFGHLCTLEGLSLWGAHRFRELSDNFGDLSSLETLKIVDCKKLGRLPDSFGPHLDSLKRLDIWSCPLLECLPDSFSQLSGLQQLNISSCSALKDLGGSFGSLSSLRDLSLGHLNLQSLSEDFGNLASLQEMTMDNLGLEILPDSFSRLKSIRKLVMRDPALKTLPEGLGEFSQLEELDVHCKKVEVLPTSLGKLSSLRVLRCKLPAADLLSENFGQLLSIQTLEIECHRLEKMPNIFSKLSSLRQLTLTVKCCGSVSFPREVGNLSSLLELTVTDCPWLKYLPEEIGKLSSLRKLTIRRCSGLESLPEGLGSISSLEDVDITDCPNWNSLSNSLGKLSSLKKCAFRGNLESLPESIWQLKSLERLLLKVGNATSLPESLGKLSSLQKLLIEGKDLESLPESIGQLQSLKTLNLKVEKARSLPESLGKLSSLQKLLIEGKDLESLPGSIGQLKSLERLDLKVGNAKSLLESLGQMSSLKKLSIEGKALESLPESIGQLKSLERLDVKVENARSLPDSLGKLSSLAELLIEGKHLESLPECIGQLQSLKTLNLKVEKAASLPESLGKLSSLQDLLLEGKDLENLPESIGQLKSLERLDLKVGNARSLPESLGKLSSLQEMLIEGKDLESLPESIGQLKSLEKLDLKVGNARSLPESLRKLSSLQKLLIEGKDLESLPESIGQIQSLKTLNLKVEKARSLPESLGKLSSLQELLIEGKDLESLPESIGQLKSLERLDLKVGNAKSLPESLGKMSSLQKLSIAGKDLESFPESIGQLKSLERLDLKVGNARSLPESLGKMSSLKKMSIEGNDLESLPESIGQLKSLERLHLKVGNARSLPEGLGKFSSLHELLIEGKDLESLPESIGELHSLRELNLGVRNVRSLPESIKLWSSLRRFTFNCDGHQRKPVGFEQLASLAQDVTLTGKNIRILRDGLVSLPSVRNLTLQFKCLESLPEDVRMLSSLEELQIRGCDMLETLPESLGRLPNLTMVTLRRCRRLKSLPDSLGKPPLSQVALTQGDIGNDIMSLAEDGSSQSTAGQGTLLQVYSCPLLNDLVLGTLGWVLVSDGFFKTFRRKPVDEGRAP